MRRRRFGPSVLMLCALLVAPLQSTSYAAVIGTEQYLGAMERERTRDPGREQVWTTPGGDDRPVPRDGRVFLYAVVRDARGGMDWVRREVRVE